MKCDTDMEENHGNSGDLRSSADKLSPWLQEALHSLSRRIPKICLQRIDQVYPLLIASQLSDTNIKQEDISDCDNEATNDMGSQNEPHASMKIEQLVQQLKHEDRVADDNSTTSEDDNHPVKVKQEFQIEHDISEDNCPLSDTEFKQEQVSDCDNEATHDMGSQNEPFTRMKIEQLVCQLKHEDKVADDNSTTSEDDNHPSDTKVKQELLSDCDNEATTTQRSLISAANYMGSQNEAFTSKKIEQLVRQLKNEDMVADDKSTASEDDNHPVKIKQEFQIEHDTSEDNCPIVARSSGVLSSCGNSDNNSLTIPIPQHEHISVDSETDEDISQQKDVDLCSYSCNFCSKMFNNFLQLQKHICIHEDKRSTTLAIECQRSNVQEQRNNGRLEIGNRHICRICNKSFSCRSNLIKHIRIHTGERPFPCKICNKSFTQKGDLNIHMRTHTGERPFSCEICKKSFSQHGHLKTHMKTHTGERPFSCEICNKSFTVRGHLNKHLRTHTGERPFPCKICNKSFTQKEALNTHMLTHTGERPFSCEICKKSFSQHGYLKIHVKTHTGERPFSCRICKKSFTQKSDLNRHLKTHTGERPFSCEICNKSFSQKIDLIKHIKTHTGERPFSCKICNKSFSQSGNLANHMNTHTDERPFSCEICKKSFTQKFHLNRHIKTHTGERSFSSEICNKTFTRSGSITKHLNTHTS